MSYHLAVMEQLPLEAIFVLNLGKNKHGKEQFTASLNMGEVQIWGSVEESQKEAIEALIEWVARVDPDSK